MNRPPARTALWVACAALASSRPPPAPAQEKKKDEDKGPRVTMVSPLAVAPGAAATLKVRGLRLAEATEVRPPEAKPAGKAVIKSQGKAEMSQGLEAAEVGDTQVEVELTVPPETPPGALAVVVVTPAGETKPYELEVIPTKSLVPDKEPNDGFRQAQALSAGQVVAGTVQSGEDVDVFRFEGRSGQKLVAEVTAARRGSALDSLLTLYGAAGHVLATNDDGGSRRGDVGGAGGTSADSVLRFQCTTDGTYYLALTDANARGGPAHPYLLALKAAE